MKTSSAKSKGRKFQQWCRDLIIQTLKPFGVEPEDVKSTSMGAQGEDVQLSPFARSLWDASIECKSHKSMAVYKWYEQATSHGESEPVLFIKANHKKPLVVVDANHYMELVRGTIERDNST